MLQHLHQRMPPGPCPPNDSKEWRPFREQIQRALVETISDLDEAFANEGFDAGCTVTICVVVRPLNPGVLHA
jgi:hypothetical protein